MKEIKIIYPKCNKTLDELSKELRDFFNDKEKMEELVLKFRKINNSL